MRWKDKSAKVILSLRALVQSKGRWQQFWHKVDQYIDYKALANRKYTRHQILGIKKPTQGRHF
jgi:hypothetical protein